MLNKSLFKNPNLRLESQDGKEQHTQQTLLCEGCQRRFLESDLENAFYICPRCNHSHKMTARQRVRQILDEGSFLEMDPALVSKDPLGFPAYKGKLSQSREQSGENEAVITGIGRIDGMDCAFFASEYRFMMGSMGAAVGEKLSRLFERAIRERLPVIGFTISGGARVQEGILSLMQMAKVSGCVRAHSDAGLLYVVVLCDATTGGVAASFAMQADIILAEPGALIGFAGPRVIEQTTRQKLPEGFQRAEFQLEKGFVDLLCPRNRQRDTLSHLLRLHQEDPNGRV